MKLHVGKRAYISQKEIDCVERSIPSLAEAAELGKRYGVNLTFIPTVDIIGSEPRVNALLEGVKKSGWNLSSTPYNQTAGQKFSAHLFDNRPGDKADIVALMCLDQFPLDKGEHWSALMYLASKLYSDEKTYATGSRNVPVTLAVHRDNSERRIIHEMIHTLAGGTNQFRSRKMPDEEVHPAYDKLGESTSGLYILNRRGKFYPRLQRIVQSNEAVSSARGFAIEYMAAILAARQDQVSSGYVYAVKNPFYGNPPEEETEKADTLKWIGKQTELVGMTPAKEPILYALLDENVRTQLVSVFDETLVDEIRAIMQKSLVAQ